MRRGQATVSIIYALALVLALALGTSADSETFGRAEDLG